jgi:hypothetical protein
MATFKNPFMQKPDAGFRLGDIRSIFDAVFNMNGASSGYGIAAAGTTRADATALTSVFNQVETVGASSGVNLPLSTGARSTACQICIVNNTGANNLQVYGAKTGSDTINGISGATGITLGVNNSAIFFSTKPGAWFSTTAGAASFTSLTANSIVDAGNLTFTAPGAGIVLKQGSNGKCGTFVCNQATPVSVANTSIAITDTIVFSLNTVGGTVGAIPTVKTITASTGFTVAGSASDTSTYNYVIISNAA